MLHLVFVLAFVFYVSFAVFFLCLCVRSEGVYVCWDLTARVCGWVVCVCLLFVCVQDYVGVCGCGSVCVDG